MKRSFIIIGVLIFVLILIVSFLLLKGNLAIQSVTNSNAASGFPIANSTHSGTISVNTGGSSNTTVVVASQTGTPITTNDFIHNGATVEDTSNPGNYYLAGSIGYCLANGYCPSGATSTEYHIEYLSESKSFIIALISEPIGQARLDAEQFLMKTLGLTQQQMCDLQYQVLTTDSVNSQYAGENLGFSFCPGAVQLPQ